MTPGDTRAAPCSWCKRPGIKQTYRAYGDGLSGGYWDTGNCPCGSLAGMLKYGRAVVAGSDRTGKKQEYRNGAKREERV